MALTVKGCCCMSLRQVAKYQKILGFILGVTGVHKTIDYISADDNQKKEVLYDVLIRNKLYVIIYWIITIGEATTSLILEEGIKKNEHHSILPCLIWRGTWIVAIIPALCILSAMSIISSDLVELFVIIEILLIWNWIVIYSLYVEIRNSQSSEGQEEIVV